MNLTKREVGLMGVLKGVHKTAEKLELPQSYVREAVLSIEEDPFFHKLREYITQYIQKTSVEKAARKFFLPKNILQKLLEHEKECSKEQVIQEAYRRIKSTCPAPTTPQPKLPKKTQNPELFSVDSFIRAIPQTTSKEVSSLDSNTKLLIVSELQKTKDPTVLSDEFGVIKDTMEYWAKSYHQKGKLPESQLFQKAASEVLVQAYEELVKELGIVK